MEKTVEYEKYRVTVGTVTALGYGRYQSLQREGRRWAQAQGLEPGAPLDTEDPDQAALLQVLNVDAHRSYMIASLRRVEIDGQDAPLPWDTIETFGQMPFPLYLAWMRAARECNPGVFWIDASDEGKA